MANRTLSPPLAGRGFDNAGRLAGLVRYSSSQTETQYQKAPVKLGSPVRKAEGRPAGQRIALYILAKFLDGALPPFLISLGVAKLWGAIQ